MSGTPTAIADLPAGRRNRRPHAYRRLLTALRISAWSAAWLLTFGAIVLLLFLHRGDAEGSARIANREIDLALERGEGVVRRVPVMRRHWWHFFRVTHGVLAATDRRLIYVGVPPEELLPHEEEPLELEFESWSYENGMELRRRRAFFETRPALAVTIGDRVAIFATSPHEVPKLDAVVSSVDQRLALLDATREAERRAAEATALAARRPIYHLVQPGETLEGIAQRYGVSTDSLREWNGVAGQRILAGERLLVNPGR
jgi:hypothetical protein